MSPAPVVGKAMSGSRILQANHIISISAAAYHHGGPQQSIESVRHAVGSRRAGRQYTRQLHALFNAMLCYTPAVACTQGSSHESSHQEAASGWESR